MGADKHPTPGGYVRGGPHAPNLPLEHGLSRKRRALRDRFFGRRSSILLESR
jgi:hypothetical protein